MLGCAYEVCLLRRLKQTDFPICLTTRIQAHFTCIIYSLYRSQGVISGGKTNKQTNIGPG